MSKRYKIRYIVERPALTIAFWHNPNETDSSFHQAQELCKSLSGTSDYSMSLDGLTFTVSFTFQDSESRDKFYEGILQIDEEWQKTNKKEWDERNDYHTENNLAEKTEFIEESS